MELLVIIGVFAPLVGAMIAGFFGRRIGNIASQAVTTGLLFLSCAIAWTVFSLHTWHELEAFTVELAPFINVGDFQSAWSIRIDALSAVMLIVVTTVSSLVHLYSWGYMAEDDSRPRFFAYLSLFTFAMLALVTAADFMQLFFGWEGVGLASYLLIGFWFKKPSANAAAIKAFVVNRVGDLGFMLGIFGTYLVFQTTSIPEILAEAPAMSGSTITFVGMRLYTMDILCILLFIGAMGKSAQLGLHTWLPDAMEGPTPVSALIHAATMVTAGVFMVCRLSPMFETAPTALMVVTVIGAATCFFAATIGTTQWDIKRVIAYSTCSQLGYMFFAAGVGAYGVAMFHLFTHAFFKALLFLGAGSVIHAMHHEQDMRYYGGLRKRIPFTFYAMLAGTLAITGLGVYHLGVGFAGFWSKDAVLEVAFARDTEISVMSFWLGVGAALLTSFYSWRLMFLTFWGKPRWIESEHIQHSVHKTPEQAGEDTTGGYHPHESPVSMLVPLGLLGIGAVAAGQVFAPSFLDNAAFWAGSIFYNEPLIHAMHAVPYWVKYSALVVMLLGFAGAYLAYIAKPDIPAKFVATFGGLHNFVYRKWYFDELYDRIFVKPAFWLGRQFWKLGDIGMIDRFGPNGIAWVVDRSAVAAKSIQSGYLYTYALIMLLGLVAAITYVLL
ncbi:MAG: NADH-quinone oxidoreductase subunit L [Erythrobacter sp.]|nr:NADH-quinone oxidoreductase subunit L [Erythrobacter sp.]